MKKILYSLLPKTPRAAALPLWEKGFNFFLAILVPLAWAASGREVSANAQNANYRMKTVVIDAGHGGHDPGCSGSDSREKHIALAVAKSLATAIQNTHPDLRVILTRDTDVFIPLHERAAIANRNQADLFISIHCNFMPGKSFVQGSETYVMGLHTAEHNLEVAKRENASILLEDNYQATYGYDPNSPEGHITMSMFQSAFIEQSILFADLVEKQFAMAGRKSRGVRQAGFMVLKGTAMPSALIEIGYLSNREEELFLKGEEGQAVIVQAILKAFTQYRNELEGATAKPAVVMRPDAPLAAPAPVAPEQIPAPERASAPRAEPAVATSYPAANTGAAATRTPPASTAPAPSAYAYTRPESERPLRASQPAPASSPATPAVAAVAPLQFCIQLAASVAPSDLNAPNFKNLGHKVEEVREDGRYKYQIRNLPTYEQAHLIRQKVIAGGFPGAFIVAYQGERRISIEEALRLSN